ncbi:hypothetical protein GWI33_019895 [Rhynchophorus ferrugineus]|uniref:Uncharacterized protein n=1 Tax=Rhynchophorus ferrugineus TaxID=354439 RepID=A0A834HSR7_RHYFE|nr:hypothetical protein GWI33_019895 [Rhynchophorus ferrugineus]
MDYHLTQALTGHGPFGSYLKKIGKVQTDACWYCRETDTPSYTLFVGREWIRLGDETEGTVGETVTVENAKRLINSDVVAREALFATLKEIMRRK